MQVHIYTYICIALIQWNTAAIHIPVSAVTKGILSTIIWKRYVCRRIYSQRDNSI